MDNFPEKYNLSKLILIEAENLNRSVTREKIEKEKISAQ